MVSEDPKCHTYCVRNTYTGQEKVVHRNLLLQVNFLPTEAEELESSLADDSEQCQEQSDIPTQDTLVTESEVDRLERTASCVVDAIVSNAGSESECVPSGMEISHHVSLEDIKPDFDRPQVSQSVKSMDTPVERDKDNNEAGSAYCEEGPEVSVIDPVSQLAGEETGSFSMSPNRAPPSNAVALVRTRVGETSEQVDSDHDTKEHRQEEVH